MQKIKIHINPNKDCTIRNEMHFNIQLKTRAHVFENRKRKAKNGYMKHKCYDM